MRNKFNESVILILVLTFVVMGGGCSLDLPYPETVKASKDVATTEIDPEIAAALALIEKMPDSAKGHVQLAMQYIKAARRTGDFSLNTKAESAVNKALEISPSDFTARKLQASLQLTFHRFDKGLELGEQLKTEFPNDAFVYGVLTDANAEMGNYQEAKVNAQKMVDLRPDSSSYARVAHIRSLFGNHQGAVEMYIAAARTADPADKEAQSWCLVSLGKEYFKVGKFELAANSMDEALSISPGYQLALLERSRIKAALGDYDGALAILNDDKNRLQTPQAYILRGDIASLQGKSGDADAEYQRAEQAARDLDGDLHPFALLWADHDVRLDEALDIAEKDFAVIKDIYAADTLSWCLYKKQRYKEAETAVNEALRIKTNDAKILYHAGMIANALGNKKAARDYLRFAIKTNPKFDLLQAEVAANTLRSLQ